MRKAYVYILTNYNNTVLYIGVTSNLIRRISEHKNGTVVGFSKKYRLNKLVYYEIHQKITDALTREKYLKGKNRKYKEELINSINSSWLDLSESLAE